MNTTALRHKAALLATALCLLTSAGCRAQAPKPALPPPALPSPATPLWTDTERAACVTFWSRAGRMSVSLLPARAALTPEASVWFSAFGRALRTAAPTEAAAWNAWVDARFARDRWEAAQLAGSSSAGPEPAPPGVIPAPLLAAAGDPPALAAAVAPKRYRITLGDGPPLVYVAPVAVPPRYPAYRSAEGVVSGGAALKGAPPGELDGLCGRRD